MDGKEQVRFRSFTRRAALLSAGGLGVFGLLFSRLYQLQVLNADQYRMKAEENRMKMRLMSPLRGRIVDRFGVELAGNRTNLRVLLVPEDTGEFSVEDVLNKLSQVVKVEDFQREKVLKIAKRQAKFVPVLVTDNLTWRDFTQVNLLSPDLPGIQPEVGDTRFYPFADEMAHVLGYVAAVAERDLDDDPLLRLPGFRIGKDGIERKLDTRLRGSKGTRQVEVNAGGRVIRELSRVDGKAGQEAVLTLDMEVQRVANATLEGESGAAVVLDVHTGEVIACASTPGFDPAAFNRGLTHAEWDALQKNELKPLINKAVSGQYPPGSTIKPVVALAALQNRVIDPNETVLCMGKTRLGKRTLHCWKKHGHGPMNMHDGIKHSCDIYFYEIAKRMGMDPMASTMSEFGLGQTYEFELPGEKEGIVPTRGWKLAMRGERWAGGDTLNAGIGQGFVLSTPLQLAVMTARLANGGKQVVPRIIRSVGEDLLVDTTKLGRVSASRRHIDFVRRAMNAVTNEGGTAARSRLEGEGMSMAGKTGTSQVFRITKAERDKGVRKQEDLPWRLRDHGSFIGYGPVEAPKYAVSVIVEHGMGGSKAAAPRARDIMKAALLRDPAAKKAVGPKPVAPQASAPGNDDDAEQG
jgi:penicillin-binding protein 2